MILSASLLIASATTHAAEIELTYSDDEGVMDFAEMDQTSPNLSRQCAPAKQWQQHKGYAITNQLYIESGKPQLIIKEDRIGIQLIVKKPDDKWVVVSGRYEDLPIKGFYIYDILSRALGKDAADCHVTLYHPHPNDAVAQ